MLKVRLCHLLQVTKVVHELIGDTVVPEHVIPSALRQHKPKVVIIVGKLRHPSFSAISTAMNMHSILVILESKTCFNGNRAGTFDKLHACMTPGSAIGESSDREGFGLFFQAGFF